jgi:PAS domain S-box-containing protein
VLIVAESEDEVLPLLQQLQQVGFEPAYERVNVPIAMEAALARQQWDLVLSDWTLPQFSGLEALRLFRQAGQDAPFILVGGAIGEEAVVSALQAGAQGYVRKDNLLRLGAEVERALRETGERRARRRTEEALLQSEERYRRIVETAYEGIWLLDADARTTYVNQRLASMLGYSVEEMLGHSLDDFVCDAGARSQAAHNWERRRQGISEQHEFPFCRKDRSTLWTFVSACPLYDERHEFGGALGLVTDITELKRAEEALKEAKALYECLVEEALVGVYMLGDGDDPRFLYVNPRFAEMLGYAREELAGMSVLDVVAPESRPLARENICRRLGGEVEAAHYYPRCLRKDGTVLETEVLGTRTEYHGQPVILGTMLDITERKQTEERIRRQQEALVELAKHPTLTAGDVDAALRQITEAAARTLNVERVGVWLYENHGAKLRNVELYQLTPDRHSSAGELTVADYPGYFKALEAGRALALDDAFHDAETQELVQPYLCSLGISSMLDAPIRLHGQTVGIVCHEHVGPARHWGPEQKSFAGSVADMAALVLEAAERKRAEEALRGSDERLRAIVDNTPAIIYLKSLDGRFLLVNRHFERLCHMHREEMLGKTDHELFPREFADTYRANDRKVLETGTYLEAEEHAFQDGDLHTYLSIKFLLRDSAGVPYALGGISTDITERKRAEERLRESERLLAEAEQVARFGSWQWDVETGEERWSAETYRLLGYPPGESITNETFLSRVHPDDRARVVASIEESVREGTPIQVEYRIVLPDGEVRWMSSQSETRTGESGHGRRLVGMIKDITRRKRAEEALEAARQSLLQAEVEKKQFTREVLRAVTQGKLHLVEPSEIPDGGRVVAEFSFAEPSSYGELRKRIREIEAQVGMSRDHGEELVLAVGEAVTNSIKHATAGRATVAIDTDRLVARISDSGPGIRPENLPATVLQAGFSTKVSLGMGYTLMLQLSDCIWLATGPEGTVVQLAKWIHPEAHVQDPLLALLDRFDTELHCGLSGGEPLPSEPVGASSGSAV